MLMFIGFNIIPVPRASQNLLLNFLVGRNKWRSGWREPNREQVKKCWTRCR